MLQIDTEGLAAQLRRITAPRLTRDQFDNITSILAAKFASFDPGAKAQARAFELLKQHSAEELYGVVCEWLRSPHVLYQNYYGLHNAIQAKKAAQQVKLMLENNT